MPPENRFYATARYLSLLLALSLLLSCSSLPEEDASTRIPVYPPPPAEARFSHEISLFSARQIQPETDQERLKRALTGDAGPDSSFVKPLDVAASRGRIYVTDSLAGVIHVFDVPRQRYFLMGYRREGTLSKPTGIHADNLGRVLVADPNANRIVIFDHLGLFLGEISGEGGILTKPVSVATNSDGSRIYVVDNGGVDTQDHRVVVFDRKGNKLFQIGKRGHGEGQLNLPADIAIGTNGNLYILDAGNFRVQIFDPKGNYLKAWGSVGRSFGNFARPRYLAIDAQNQVYITDAFYGNIQIFNSDGELLLPIGENGAAENPGEYGLIAGVDIDETGRIYTVDQVHQKIEIYKPVID